MKNIRLLYNAARQLLITIALCFLVVCSYSQVKVDYPSKEVTFELKDLIPDSRVVVNVPAKELINPKLPTRIVFFALPNGNTIEQTAGKLMTPTDDWHFDIQHIAAQTRFLREKDRKHNYIVIYLQTSMKAWTAHAAKYPESPKLYTHLIDTVCTILASGSNETISAVPLKNQEIIISSYSGGGRFVFNYIAGVEKIPSKVKGIVFIDSSYGYEDSLHADKLANWILNSKKNRLAGFSYIDTTVIFNGEPIVSSKGGTGYRSRMMADAFTARGIKFRSYSDTAFRKYIGLGGSGPSGGRLQILIKENPTGQIYHTVLVERNGFIHSLLIGTPLEEKGYKFWGKRAYNSYIW